MENDRDSWVPGNANPKYNKIQQLEQTITMTPHIFQLVLNTGDI